MNWLLDNLQQAKPSQHLENNPTDVGGWNVLAPVLAQKLAAF